MTRTSACTWGCSAGRLGPAAAAPCSADPGHGVASRDGPSGCSTAPGWTTVTRRPAHGHRVLPVGDALVRRHGAVADVPEHDHRVGMRSCTGKRIRRGVRGQFASLTQPNPDEDACASRPRRPGAAAVRDQRPAGQQGERGHPPAKPPRARARQASRRGQVNSRPSCAPAPRMYHPVSTMRVFRCRRAPVSPSQQTEGPGCAVLDAGPPAAGQPDDGDAQGRTGQLIAQENGPATPSFGPVRIPGPAGAMFRGGERHARARPGSGRGEIGHIHPVMVARAANTVSSRESTWPAAAPAGGRAGAWSRGFCSSWRPAEARAATSARRLRR